MPVARLTADRIRSGTQVVANITSAYAVTALTVQSDQGVVNWILDANLTIPPHRMRVSKMANLTQRRDGKYRFVWGFTYMTDLMYKYWTDSFLASGVEWALNSVMTYNEYGVAVYLNATLLRPPLETFKRVLGGWQDVQFEFVDGTIIT